MKSNRITSAGHRSNTFVSRRFFRIFKIRLFGRYKLLKRIHRKIVIDLLYAMAKKYSFKNFDDFIKPDELNEAINMAQIEYMKSVLNGG